MIFSINLNNNFLFRAAFKFLGVFIMFIVSFFILLVPAESIAIFFLVRKLVYLFAPFFKILFGGQYFFNLLLKNNNKSFFYKHLGICFIGTFLFSFVIFLFWHVMESFNLLYITSDFIKIMSIFWFCSIAISYIFQHYFQVIRYDFLSGLSTGFIANLLILFSVLFFYFTNLLNLENLIFSFSIGWILNLLIFLLFIVFLREKEHMHLSTFDYSYIKDRKILEESITSVIYNSPILITLLISTKFFDPNIVAVVGFALYLVEFVSLIPNMYELSIRIDFKKITDRKSRLSSFYRNYRSNLLRIHVLMLAASGFFIYLINFFKNNLKDYFEVNLFISAGCLFLIFLFLRTASSIFVPRNQSLIHLAGYSRDALKFTSIAIFIMIILIFILSFTGFLNPIALIIILSLIYFLIDFQYIKFLINYGHSK